MSGAQHGYVDPSSTDKGTADETDEVDLQVLCLTGEGVTISVPCSMLGSELHRLVSEKLPCKPRRKARRASCEYKADAEIEPWQSKELLGNLQCCPTLTYQQMCTLHGVMSVGSGSQLVRERVCWKVLHNLRQRQVESIYIIFPAALQI